VKNAVKTVDVWWRHTAGIDAAGVAAAAATLSPDELTRSQRFRFDDDRRDYVLAHHLLRQSLSASAVRAPHEWRFDADASGKPSVRGSAISISLSHTRGFVACALSRDVRVGVDVECVDRSIDACELAAMCLDPCDAARVRASTAADAAERFFALWTLKEAVAKATGEGLNGSAPAPVPGVRAWQQQVAAPPHAARLAVVALCPTCEPVTFRVHFVS
jgi:4'-phosphopantetheinyl transferase